MSFCANCGTDLGSEPVRFCPNCGAPHTSQPQPAAPQPQPDASQPQAAIPNGGKAAKKAAPDPGLAPDGLNRHGFLRAYSAGAKLCMTAAVLAYISAGVTLILLLVGGQQSIVDASALLDVVILLVLGLLLHLLYSRVSAILLLIYGVFNAVYMTIQTGQLAGYLILAAGILAVIGAFGCAKDWRNYRLRQSGAGAQG